MLQLLAVQDRVSDVSNFTVRVVCLTLIWGRKWVDEIRYAEEVISDLADVLESETKRIYNLSRYRDQAPLQTTSVLLKKTKFAIWAYLLGQMSVMQGKKKRKGEELIDRPDRRQHENQTA